MWSAEIVLAALTLVTPPKGATVELLRKEHRGYLALDQSARYRQLDDFPTRQRLYKSGYVQPPIKLSWTGGDKSVELEIAAEGGERQVFALTNATFAYITNLELGRKYEWKIRSGGEEATSQFETSAMPPRLLRINGVVNARDLGGWKGLGGKTVRQGMIFRSGGLRGSAVKKGDELFAGKYEDGGRNISDEGIAFLRDELKVRTDIEVRSATETVFMESSALGKDVKWHKEPFVAYQYIENIARGREPFAKLFKLFCERENYPVLFHCSGGRDRTGTLSFLLLGLLGVGEDDLSRDWEASIFSEESLEFGSGRIGRMTGYMRTQGDATITECCVSYAHSCGITDEEIARFREIMLEGGAAK